MNLPTLPSTLPDLRLMSNYGDIGQSLCVVEELRRERQTQPRLALLTSALRQWQAKRFRQTYADVLQDLHMGPAALFFLTELYSEHEYSQRDAQFARIAGTIERLFPRSVVKTATLLAQMHALSESLDACMALTWMSQIPESHNVHSHTEALDFSLYQSLWRALLQFRGYTTGRAEQLQATHALGIQLQQHTQVTGLRLMLKMMRKPASAAGLHDLQRFLELGFDTFGQLGRAGKVPLFLDTVGDRESAWLATMAG